MPFPGLQFTIPSGDTVPVGSEPWVDARITNPRNFGWFAGLEPGILTLSSPLLPAPVEGTLWWNWGSYYVSANLPTTNGPGVYEVVARASTAELVARRAADTNFIAWLDLMLPLADRMEISVTQQVTIVTITNLTASAYHVAIGDTVTNTVTMTPVNAFDLVLWDRPNAQLYYGTGETFTRVMTDTGPWGPASNGVLAVTATCGNVTLTNLITVYQITNVTASNNPISTAEPLTLTATLSPDPGTNSLPIIWYADFGTTPIGTGPTITLTNQLPGVTTFFATCGTSCKYVTVTFQFAGTISLTATPEDIPIGTTATFTATLAPAGTPNSVAWQHPNYIGTDYAGGLTREYYFAYAGTQPVSITCDLVTTNKAVRVYEVTAVTASPSLVAVGSNITFTATLYGGPNPPPLVWKVDGVLDTNSTGVTFTTSFPTAGVKEVSAWCGTISSKSAMVTNVGVGAIEFYRITSETVGGGWFPDPDRRLGGGDESLVSSDRENGELSGAAFPRQCPVADGQASLDRNGGIDRNRRNRNRSRLHAVGGPDRLQNDHGGMW